MSNVIDKPLRFYTVEKLGATQEKTPEGFLLCRDVAIARTGEMLYGPNETPVEAGADGVTRITRDEEEVFRAETVASFEGKPVVNDHPDEDVTPANWKDLAVGSTLHVRRGTGVEGDLLLADLLITDASAIEDVLAGKREVSCGYDADYEQLAPGRGRQTNIIGNHVALVERGRCGSRCSIGDKETEHMSWKDRLKKAFASKDEKEFNAALEEQEQQTRDAASARDAENEKRLEKVENAVKDIKDGFENFKKETKDSMEEIKKEVKDRRGKDEDEEEKERKEAEDKLLEGNLEMEAPPGTGDRARKARDSQFLGDSFQETVAMAEIIAPGIRVPAYDAKAEPKKTFDAICGLRRKALQQAVSTADGRTMVEEVLGREEFDLTKLTCDATRTLFRGVHALKRRANNHDDVHTATSGNGAGVKGAIKSPADLNKRMAELYK